jgi:hypothetical protein
LRQHALYALAKKGLPVVYGSYDTDERTLGHRFHD